MNQYVFNRESLIITNFNLFPKFLGIVLLITLFSYSSVNAQTMQEKRIDQLEKKIDALSQEIMELKNENSRVEQNNSNERIDALERKLSIIADEVNDIKTGGAVSGSKSSGDSNIVGIFGGAPGASKIYGKGKGLSIGGYGEIAVGQIKNNGDNQLDTLRAVLYTGYKFNENILFNSEIEFEHGGEEVEVEFALIDFLIRKEFNLRAGLLLVPFGITNEIHEPTTFYGVLRPSVESKIIPTTWRESGAGAFGTFGLGSLGELSYKTYVMNSVNSTGFKASDNRGIRQNGSEAIFNDIAFATRIEYDPFPGLKFGGSTYIGNSGQNDRVQNESSTLNGTKIDGFFQMYEADAQYQFRGLDLRTLLVWTFLDDAELINANNGFKGDQSVGKEQFGWYITAAYNLLNEFDLPSTYLKYLATFVRYEFYNSQKSVPEGFSSDPANERKELTIGINYKPIPNVVVKIDYQWLDNDADTANNQLNFGMGYVF